MIESNTDTTDLFWYYFYGV